ncbi:hypothetical protein O6H91_20G023400 [Diphasiastrum complanatum]|uniref:Uncharacterized protein n=1 Tax=Diphasiastrum complanatum TaxID=34168 RepID=A0ACC2ANI2_DIPCM|nr:hypothetical protein O6H91_20G023400 [Diphasiastrum complanatum]
MTIFKNPKDLSSYCNQYHLQEQKRLCNQMKLVNFQHQTQEFQKQWKVNLPVQPTNKNRTTSLKKKPNTTTIHYILHWLEAREALSFEVSSSTGYTNYVPNSDKGEEKSCVIVRI